jgi:hypothetical protein
MNGILVHLKSGVRFENRKQAKLCYGGERFRKMLKTGEIRIVDLANEDETNANDDDTEQDLPD